MDKELKCPNCGAVGTLVFQSMQQCAYEHKVLKNGRISKRKKFVHIGPEEWHMLRCEKCCSCWTDTDTEGGFETTKNGIVFQEEKEDYRNTRRKL